MTKTSETERIEQALWKSKNTQGVYGCFEVSIGIGIYDERVDFITYESNGEFRCYEIKVSVEDFYSKAKKSFYGDFNYYVIPFELHAKLKERAYKEFENDKSKERYIDIFDRRIKNSGVGLMTVSKKGTITTVIKPKRQFLRVDMRTKLLESMIRSLSRDVNKYYESICK